MFRTIAIASLAAAASATSFTTCATDKLGVKSVTLNPVNPVAGQPLNVKVDGHTGVNVSGGTATVTVKVLGITIDTEKFDLCNDLGITCPVAANNDFEANVNYPIPSAAPSGVTASVELSIKDAAGATLSCLDLKVQTGKAASMRAAKTSQQEVEFLFEAWRMEHGVQFESAAEYVERLAIFAANHVRIIEHNSSGAEWTMAHNQFSHLTPMEFKAQLNGYVPQEKVGDEVPFDLDVSATPTSIDWTTKGAVTGVKDQGQCGSCWSFSTTGAVEGAYFLKTGRLVSVSEQELVDCDTADGGCNGGWMDTAFGFVKQNGLCAESDYAYKAVGGTCKKSSCTAAIPAGAITGYTDVPAGSESALLAAVAARPVSVAIEADQSAFQFYSSGVMSGTCGTNLDHGVLAVGYGTDGSDYWKVKNSWGAGWGEKGYIRIQRGTNKCGIANAASYPTY